MQQTMYTPFGYREKEKKEKRTITKNKKQIEKEYLSCFKPQVDYKLISL